MLELLLTSIYFLLPAYIANMSPVFAVKLNLPLGKPISSRLFGSHKSWRGFYAAYIGAFLTLLLQSYFQGESFFEATRLIDYQNINLWLYAFLFGIGAIFGDLTKSYFKRRLKIKPGRPWFPFDQLDLVVGALIFVYPFHQLPWSHIVALLIVTPLLHFLTNLLGYLLGLKKVWW